MSVFLLDPTFRVLDASDVFCDATRTSRDAIVGRAFFDVFPEGPLDASRLGAASLRASLERVVRTGAADRLALTGYDVSGGDGDGELVETRVLRACSAPVLDAEGALGAILVWLEDASEEGAMSACAAADAARRLGESERRYLFLADAVPLLIFTAAPDGAVDYCNERFREVTGLPIESLLGDGWLDVVHEGDRAATRGTWEEAVAARRELQIEHRIRQRDGSYRTYLTTARPYRDRTGAVRKWFGASADVHDRVVADEQLRQAQRLQAVGKLASGFAHEVNNMMMVVVSAGEFALGTLVPGHPARADLEEILKAAGRANDVSRQLLAYSRQQVLRAQIVDLREIVESLVPALRRLVGSDRALEVRLLDEQVAVRVDRSQMELVLINLVANARDATAAHGTIEIAVDVEGPREDRPGVRRARVVVRDDGRGMHPDVAARAFEPFFTTKEVGRGTGLGLSMVYGVVEQSDGLVEIESAPGRGTSIAIHLPIEGALPERAAGGPGPETDGDARILVVEDDDTVRRLVCRALEGHGYTVFEASTGVAALEFMAVHGDDVDLVLTDVVMPRMTGPELVDRLRVDRPDVPFVFMSGYTGDEIVERGFRLGDAPLLQKPFGVDTLLATVRERVANGRRNGRPRLPRASAPDDARLGR